MAAILTVTVIGLDLLKPWPLKFIFDDVLDLGNNKAIPFGLSRSQLAAVATVAFVFIALLTSWLSAHSTVSAARVEKTVTLRVRIQVFEHLHRLGFPFHQASRTGDLLQRLMGDVQGVRRLIFSSWMSLAERVIVVGGTAAVMFALDPWFAALALLPLPFHGVAVNLYTNKIKEVTRNQRMGESNATAVATESLRHIRLVKAYAAEEQASQTFTTEARMAEEESERLAKISSRFGLWSDLVNTAGVGLVLFVGALRVLSGPLTPGDLLVLTTYAKSLYRPISKLSKDGGRLSTAAVSAERLLDVMDISAEEPLEGVEAPRFRGELEFQDVHYTHPDGLKALKGLSFKVPAGSLAVMAGPNGSGKSTSLSVILRLINPQEGTLLVDGLPAGDFQLHSYRSSFAYVPQETHLFGATVRENILYGRPDASPAQIEKAARLALLDEVVEKLPNGWDEVLGEGGATLSGGEARRLMLARAALRDARILLFDEPLTGLDPAARAIVAHAIRRIGEGRTTLVVSHGPADELEPDLLIDLDNGRCLECFKKPRATPCGGADREDISLLIPDDRALELFREAGLDLNWVERDFTRVKQDGQFIRPGGTVMAFRLAGQGPDGRELVLPGYVRTSNNGGAKTLVEECGPAATQTPFGEGVRALPGGSVLFVFPNDAKLRGLSRISSKVELESVLADLDEISGNGWNIDSPDSVHIPIRYRPERRFLASVSLALVNRTTQQRKRLDLFLRYFPDNRGSLIAGMTEAIREAGCCPYLPRPLGALLDGRLFVEERVQGGELVAGILAKQVDPEDLAARLLALHASPVSIGNLVTPADLLDGVSRSLQKLSNFDPTLIPAADRITRGLKTTLPASRKFVPIHGDFHPGQIMLTGNGPMFVDFERAGMGDPFQDVGNMVAHLTRVAKWSPDDMEELFAFTHSLVAAYQRDSSGRPATDLRFFVAQSLVVRARAAFRRQEPDWPKRMRATLALAEKALGGEHAVLSAIRGSD